MLKILQNNVKKWPSILQGVLFAHRTAEHFSTGFSRFQMINQREPILPVDINVETGFLSFKNEPENNDQSSHENNLKIFSQNIFKRTFIQMMNMRDLIEEHAKKK